MVWVGIASTNEIIRMFNVYVESCNDRQSDIWLTDVWIFS